MLSGFYSGQKQIPPSGVFSNSLDFFWQTTICDTFVKEFQTNLSTLGSNTLSTTPKSHFGNLWDGSRVFGVASFIADFSLNTLLLFRVKVSLGVG